jgi:hypothetical protein
MSGSRPSAIGGSAGRGTLCPCCRFAQEPRGGSGMPRARHLSATATSDSPSVAATCLTGLDQTRSYTDCESLAPPHGSPE